MRGRTKAVVTLVIVIAVAYLVGIPQIPPFNNYQIRISADLYPHSVEFGSNASLTVTMTNVWFTVYLPKENYWAKGMNLMGGLCSYDPVGFAVYQGNLTLSALKSATPLNLSNPSVITIVNCPAMFASPLNWFYRVNGFSSISYSASFGGYWTPVPPFTGNSSTRNMSLTSSVPGCIPFLPRTHGEQAWFSNSQWPDFR